MPTPKRISTAALPSRTFRPHGRVDFELQPPLLLTLAIGPFNQELVQVLAELTPKVFREMSAYGPWLHLVRMDESALAAPEVLQSFGQLVLELAQQGIAPRATASVLDPDLEGAQLMAPLFVQSFARAGLRFAHFPTEAEARAWLQAQDPA